MGQNVNKRENAEKRDNNRMVIAKWEGKGKERDRGEIVCPASCHTNVNSWNRMEGLNVGGQENGKKGKVSEW